MICLLVFLSVSFLDVIVKTLVASNSEKLSMDTEGQISPAVFFFDFVDFLIMKGS